MSVAVLEASVSSDTVEVTGTVKWFDPAKGFGFIVPDDGSADVLLHITCLMRDGYQTAYEGARIVVEAIQRPGGMQAFKIVSMDESTARPPPISRSPDRIRALVGDISEPERVEVKWFNRIRGFGFLSRGEDTPDIFVHMETLRTCGITQLRPGQIVMARFGKGPKGLTVVEIKELS